MVKFVISNDDDSDQKIVSRATDYKHENIQGRIQQQPFGYNGSHASRLAKTNDMFLMEFRRVFNCTDHKTEVYKFLEQQYLLRMVIST